MSNVYKELREQMRRHGVRQWQVAAKMGISEFTLVRWLRNTPTEEHAAMIAEAIEELSTKEA